MRAKKITTIRYLIQGCESKERFDLMLGLTSIRSENIIEALTDYYVKGYSQTLSFTVNNVKRDKFDRADKILNATAGMVEEIKAMDFYSRNKKVRKKRVDPLSELDVALLPE